MAMKQLIIHVSHPARQRCPHCTSPLPKAGYVVSDEADVTKFVCHAHLAELGEVCRLEWSETAQPPPDFDYFQFYPYGYLY